MRIYGRSYQGKQHRAKDTPCQDAWSTCKTPDGWLVAAVADGVGASRGSELGSQVAVDSVMKYFASFRSPFWDDESIKFALRDAFNYALRYVRQATESLGAEAYSGLTTLHVLLYDERIGLHWGQCGDGALFLRGEAGLWKRITMPMKDDEDSLSPITLQQGVDRREFGSLHPERVSVILLATDGLAEAIYDRSQTPETRRATVELVMNPQSADLDNYYNMLFFGDVPDATDVSPEAIARRRLLAINDDITLLILSLLDEEPPPFESARKAATSAKNMMSLKAVTSSGFGEKMPVKKSTASNKRPTNKLPTPQKFTPAKSAPTFPTASPKKQRRWSHVCDWCLWVFLIVGAILLATGIVIDRIAQ